ncbi:hypothetical protein BGZ73_001920 [Actinomortierella ambigua]|nr:hypothetical protein BGZ73_001920 [Actinomortierella ambigua]
MPVPFEALIPLGIITVMFGASGGLFNKLKTSVNEGQILIMNKISEHAELITERGGQVCMQMMVATYHVTAVYHHAALNISKQWVPPISPPRYGLDRWDRAMMERDSRLTGTKRGQSHEAQAPESFSTSSAWTLESEHI